MGSLTWDIKKRGDTTLVVFSGQLDEGCDLSSFSSLSGDVTFDLAGVSRVNSEGARRWVMMMRELSDVTKLTFVRCSVPVVIQLNMIAGFKGRADVSSFFAPYVCLDSGVEEERLLTLEMVSDPLNPPEFPCEGGQLELDDMPERYFAFMLEDA